MNDSYSSSSWGRFAARLRRSLLVLCALSAASASQKAHAAGGELLFQLRAPNPEAGGSFGMTLAVADGHLLVGEPRRYDLKTGAQGMAHLFDGDSGGLIATFENPEPADLDVYRVYGYDAATGELLMRIEDPDGGPHGFGGALAYGNGLLVASSPSYDHSSESPNAGRAYAIDPTSGKLAQKLANPEPKWNDVFGGAVAAFGDRVVIGAILDDLPGDDGPDDKNPGRVWVLDRDSSETIFTLENPNPEDQGFDWFGFSLAANEQFIVVGAQEDETNGEDSGTVYVFDSQTGNLLHTLFSPHVEQNGEFGRSVALTPAGDVIVGAWGAKVDGVEGAGRVFLFDGETGDLLLDLPNPDPVGAMAFGWSVAAIGEKLAVGTPYTNGALPGAGIVYVFDAYTVPEPCAVQVAIWLIAVSRLTRRRQVRITD
jgi:outer membrane protein assembly factor BamB